MPLYDNDGRIVSGEMTGTQPSTGVQQIAPPVSGSTSAPPLRMAAPVVSEPVRAQGLVMPGAGSAPAPTMPLQAAPAPVSPVAYTPAPAPIQAAQTQAPQTQAPASAPAVAPPIVSSGGGIGSPGPIFTIQARPIDDALRTMLSIGEGASDLFFVVGRPPQVEDYGKLTPIDVPGLSSPLTPAETEGMARTLINDNPRLVEDVRNNGSCDSSYSVEGLARFRVNIFKQKGTYAIVMRKLNTKIPTMTDLKLSPVFERIIQEKTGLIFVTGATGSGKTTTLAAMLNGMNEMSQMHIVTLEDPVEFLHPHKAATFSQRELGRDFGSFSAGLRAALRQAPKVILVGEIRDRETMEIALTAAETGHVVYSTLHTISAGQSINRVLGMFSKEEEQQVRERLAETLRWVVSQRLAPKVGGGRVMVNEIMGSSLRTRETIQLGESDVRNYGDIIEASRPDGWCSFEQTLREAYEKELITAETAMLYSVNKNKMRKGLDAVDKLMGRDTTTSGGLTLVEHLPKPATPPAPAGGAPAPSGGGGLLSSLKVKK